MGLITRLLPVPTSEGATRVNYCLAIPGALMKGGGKWALLTGAGNYSQPGGGWRGAAAGSVQPQASSFPDV